MRVFLILIALSLSCYASEKEAEKLPVQSPPPQILKLSFTIEKFNFHHANSNIDFIGINEILVEYSSVHANQYPNGSFKLPSNIGFGKLNELIGRKANLYCYTTEPMLKNGEKFCKTGYRCFPSGTPSDQFKFTKYCSVTGSNEYYLSIE